MFMSIITGFYAIKLENPIYLKNILIFYAIISGMGFIVAVSIAILNIIIHIWEFIKDFIKK